MYIRCAYRRTPEAWTCTRPSRTSYVCVCICVYVHMYICIYVCIYTYVNKVRLSPDSRGMDLHTAIKDLHNSSPYLYPSLSLKVRLSPDFRGMDFHTAIKDLKNRIANYEAVYETMSDTEQVYRMCSLTVECVLLLYYETMSDTEQV